MCKKLINKHLSYVDLGDKKGEFSYPGMIAEPNRKKRLLLPTSFSPL